MPKYKEVFNDMLEYNKELFESFEDVHNKYFLNSKKYQELFNLRGEKVLQVIRKYENILCGKSESGKYGKFSSTLSDKFWVEIRIHFPLIDKVGMS